MASSKSHQYTCLSPGLLSPSSSSSLKSTSDDVSRYASSYALAQPYKHVQILPLMTPQAASGVRDEIISNLDASLRETDLFKVYQTPDLANLDKDAASSAAPHLLALLEAIYSEEFRAFVSQVTNCGPLRGDKVDVSCNVYANGGHLLCHDDVIGTRRVSFVIYLTDPDEAWEDEDGGALELFPLDTVGNNNETQQHPQPSCIPTKRVPPTYNSMVLFQVTPGVSFHAVQEVYAEDKPRLSVSGWFHAATPPPGYDTNATLAQLLEGKGADALAPLAPLTADDNLVDLRGVVNDVYLKPETQKQVRDSFDATGGSVELHDFLAPALANRVRAALKAADALDRLGGGRVPEDNAGIRTGWELQGPPHKRRFLEWCGGNGGGDDDDELGAVLGEVKRALASLAFGKLMSALTGDSLPSRARATARRFRAGLDYTVAHHGDLGAEDGEARLEASLTFAGGGEDDDAHETWASGEVGGFTDYVKATIDASSDKKKDDDGDEEQEVGPASKRRRKNDEESDKLAAAAEAAIYKDEDDEDDVLCSHASFNTITIVRRAPNMLRFVKYLSAAAPGSLCDVFVEFDR